MSISDDQAYLLRHTTLKGIQSVALIAVPASLLHAVRTTSQPRPIVFLRTLGLSTFVLGSAGGLALGWFKSGAYTLGHGNPVGVEGRDGLVLEGIRERAARLRVSRSQIKTDDYSVVGALVGSVRFSLSRALLTDMRSSPRRPCSCDEPRSCTTSRAGPRLASQWGSSWPGGRTSPSLA